MKILLCLVLGAAGVFAQPVTMESLAGSRGLWPREVTVHVGFESEILVNGKPSGTMAVSPGRTFPLRGVVGGEVVVDVFGATKRLPIGDTDVLVRAEANRERAAMAAAAAPAAIPRSTPPPAVDLAPPGGDAKVEPARNTVAAALRGKLAVVDGGSLKPFDAAALGGKKYLAVYYSAHWCPPCRAFTPELVKWYKRSKARAEAFDIIFVSSDRSEQDMVDYMKEARMPWPALRYEEARSDNPLSKYRGSGIPCLVVLDENGGVVADSYVGGNYVGPTAVMDQMDKLVKAAAR